MDCLRTSADITSELQRDGMLFFCRGCDRYLAPPKQWVPAQPESRELMALCLKRLRGLDKVKLVDAEFIWTEPHSKRIKINVTVQKDAFSQTTIQQTSEIEFVVQYSQCPDCAKTYTPNTWKSIVQIRQKVNHKRTMFYIEQIILKQRVHREATSIKETRDGIDFMFQKRDHAAKMADFLADIVPVKTKISEELVSRDTKSNQSQYKFTFSVEIVPICREDLVCLPPKLAHSSGNISPLLLCYRIANNICLIDPNTLQTTEISPSVYWRNPFPVLAVSKDMVEFIVLDVELLGPSNGKYALADVQLARSSDLGSNDTTYLVRSHLGLVISAGDTVMGYFLSNSNYNNDNFDLMNEDAKPDVIIVKKSYPERPKHRTRPWHLKSLIKSNEDDSARARKQDLDKNERDYEEFLQSVEQDDEIRENISVFKSKSKNAPSNNMDIDMDHANANNDDDDELYVEALAENIDDMHIDVSDD